MTQSIGLDGQLDPFGGIRTADAAIGDAQLGVDNSTAEGASYRETIHLGPACMASFMNPTSTCAATPTTRRRRATSPWARSRGCSRHPTLTIVALAIRQADHLAEQLSQRVI